MKFHRIACVIVAGGIAAISAVANAHPVFLGPANPGAENGLAGWYCKTLGGGSASIDDDPATGCNDFKIENSDATSRWRHHADLLSQTFPLGDVGKAHRPITVSFAYKLPDKVKPGDNIAFHLRFIELTGMRIDTLGGKTILVGSSTADSAMTQYKTMTVTNIFAPASAVLAEVWITANISEPWTSGAAQFDDISVTAASAQPWATIFGTLTTVLIGALFVRYNNKRQFDQPRKAWPKETTRESSSPPARA
jgi:hypothetical protein